MVRKPEDFDPGTIEAPEGEESLPGEDMPTTVEEYTTALQALGDRAFGGKGITFGNIAAAFGGGASALFSLLGILGNVVSTVQAKGAIAKAMEQQGFKPANKNKITQEDLNKFVKVQKDLVGDGTPGQAVGTGANVTVDWTGPTVAGYGPGGSGGTGQGVTSMTPAEVAAAAVAGGQNVNVTGRGGDSGDAQANADAAAAEAAAAETAAESAAAAQAAATGISGADVGSGGATADAAADAADTSMDWGAALGFTEGGLIKVGDKTYKPEDFGFANKGAFVTKKKTRKRKTKKGKGLASSK
jgi:hypothetical protein